MKKILTTLGAGLIRSGLLVCLLDGFLVAQENASEPTAGVDESSESGPQTDLEKGKVLAANGKLQESLPFLRKAADDGSLAAEELCARVLVTLNQPSLFDEAVMRLEKAVESGSLAALEEKARLAVDGGLGKEPDYELAKRLLEEAITRPGASESFFLLGKMAAEGLGRKKDAAMAVSLMRRGEESGSASAMFALGQLYLGEGALVEQDLPEAESLFKRAYEGKNGQAALYLGMIEERLRGESADLLKARDWFKKSADLGNATAYKKLGDYALANRGAKEEEAFGFYQVAAALEDADAAYTLGLLYEQGRTVPKDQVAAAAWFRIAADRGHALAQNQLGLLVLQGLGVAPDLDEALNLFEKSAAQGYPAARFNVAVLLLSGDQKEENKERALGLLKAAAESGHAEAAARLAKAYQVGDLVEGDPVEAAFWASRAGKDERFEKFAEELTEALGDEQKKELAERLRETTQ